MSKIKVIKMDKLVYIKKHFIITKVQNGYIVYNTDKEFEKGHTHLKSFKASKTAIDLVLNSKIPRSTNFYYLESLIRLSSDKKYIEKTWVQSLDWEDSLEEGTATHSSILWRIPRTEEPGGLQSIGFPSPTRLK